MFRIKLSKFKQVIAVAVVPKMFVRETKVIKNKLNNYTLDLFNRARKSTDSGSKDDESEKQRQIIEKCFGETSQDFESRDLKDGSSEVEKEHKTLEPYDFVRMSNAKKCDITAPDESSHEASGMQAEEASVKATTANIAEETLDQKMEKIEETPHVEASPQRIEGFNSTPKVLGHDIEFFADEKIQQIDLDDLAKRCVGAPIGNIDEMLIKEMKNMASNDLNTQPDMNLIRSHGVEKYYSEIFENFSQRIKPQKVDNKPKEPLHLCYENKSIGDKEIKLEHITPLHTDSVHLIAFDEGVKDYKEIGSFQNSFVNLSSVIEKSFLDLPSIINPYESPVMPFHEYVTKEYLNLDDFDEKESMTTAETPTDSMLVNDIERSEEVFLNKEDTDEHSVELEKHKMYPDVSKPTLSHTAEPILGSKLKENNIPNELKDLSQEQFLKLLYLYKTLSFNEIAKSNVFSRSTDVAPGGNQINPSTNSAISGTFLPEIASKEESQNIEMPENTAISANQNPGEYYNISFMNDQLPSSFSEQMQTLSAESHIIHAFCTQLQEMEDGVSKETEDVIKVLEYPVLLRDPFHFIQSDINQNPVSVLSDKITATTVENVNTSANVPASTDENLPLSQILKRIRSKNRLEFCRNLLMQNKKDKSETKNTLSPGPCKPAPKPTEAEKCPKPCPPKKDPCAKLIPFFLNTIIKLDVSFDIPIPLKQYYSIYNFKNMVTEDIIERLRKLGESLSFVKVDRDTNYINDATCGRDYEPWIPIPSWPVPKVEKRRPFVCPKEGCKPAIVPRPNPPKQRPCIGVPKKSFSFSQLRLTLVNNPDIIFINL